MARLSCLFLSIFLTSCVTVPVQKPTLVPGLEIYEIKTMSEVEKWVIPGTLVLFDLDSTVFEVQDLVGHANFYHDMSTKHPGQETKILHKMWAAIKISDVKLVETITPKLIQNLQNKGVAVMALTSRDLSLIKATLRQVKSVGVDFSKTSPTHKSKYFQDGILFADKNYPKGKALLAYLKSTGFDAKRIILVDDLEKNLVSVCADTGAIGLYYPLVDNKRHLEWDEQEAERRFNED